MCVFVCFLFVRVFVKSLTKVLNGGEYDIGWKYIIFTLSLIVIYNETCTYVKLIIIISAH